jgi:hypothetical protein
VKPMLWITLLGAVVAAFLLGRFMSTNQVGGHDLDAQAFDRALSDPDWIARGHTISAYLEDLDAAELPAALDVVAGRRRFMTQDELRLFMIAWARIDAPGAFAGALQWPDYTRNKGAASALYAWALVDPTAAREAMEGQEDAELRQLLLDRLVAAWAHGSDKAGATEFVARLAHAQKRDRYTSVLAREVYAEGPDALIAWAEDLVKGPHSKYGAVAFRMAAGVLAQDDPERAAGWVEANIRRAWAFDAPSIVGRHWAQVDPVAALTWLRGLPRSRARERALAMTFRHWLRDSPIAAETWLSTAEPDVALDPARALLIRRLAAISPADARDALDLIADPKAREEGVVQIAWNWRRSDPAAADAWIKELDLSDGARALILSEQPPPRRFGRKPANRDAGTSPTGAAEGDERDPSPDAGSMDDTLPVDGPTP